MGRHLLCKRAAKKYFNIPKGQKAVVVVVSDGSDQDCYRVRKVGWVDIEVDLQDGSTPKRVTVFDWLADLIGHKWRYLSIELVEE
jgi:hypothetical protein